MEIEINNPVVTEIGVKSRYGGAEHPHDHRHDELAENMRLESISDGKHKGWRCDLLEHFDEDENKSITQMKYMSPLRQHQIKCLLLKAFFMIRQQSITRPQRTKFPSSVPTTIHPDVKGNLSVLRTSGDVNGRTALNV